MTPGYFRAVGVPLLRGRVFTEQDPDTPDPRLIVSQAFARRYWADADPIGQRVQAGRNNPVGTIVGVVADVRSTYQREPQPAVYFAYSVIGMPSLTIALHTNADTVGVVPAVRSAVRTIDTEQPIYNIRTVDQIVTNATAQPRFQAVVVGLLGAAALVLAAFGTYSMLAYLVRQRKQEIALRIARCRRRKHPRHARRAVNDALPAARDRGRPRGLVGARPGDEEPVVPGERDRSADVLARAALLILIALTACYVPADQPRSRARLPALRQE